MTIKVALLVEDDCQDQEVWGPLHVAQAFGWKVVTFGPFAPAVLKHATKIDSDDDWMGLQERDDVYLDGFDAVIIPGGWGAERLRSNKVVLDFVRSMHTAGKVVAAICHGPWVLCSAGLCSNKCKGCDGAGLVHLVGTCTICSGEGRLSAKMTCYPGMKDDISNAGAEYIETPVVVDGNVVTSPHYRHVPEFMRAIKELVEK